MIGYPPVWKLLRLACGGVTCGIDLSRRPAFHPGNAVLIGGGLPFIVPQTWYSLAAAWPCMITPCKCARVTDVGPPQPRRPHSLLSVYKLPIFTRPIPGRPGEGTARLTLRSHPRHLVPPLISFPKQVARPYQVSPAAHLTGSLNTTPPLGDYQPRVLNRHAVPLESR